MNIIVPAEPNALSSTLRAWRRLAASRSAWISSHVIKRLASMLQTYLMAQPSEATRGGCWGFAEISARKSNSGAEPWMVIEGIFHPRISTIASETTIQMAETTKGLITLEWPRQERIMVPSDVERTTSNYSLSCQTEDAS